MTGSDLCGLDQICVDLDQIGSEWITFVWIGSDSMDGVNLCVDGHTWSHLLHETVDEKLWTSAPGVDPCRCRQ